MSSLLALSRLGATRVRGDLRGQLASLRTPHGLLVALFVALMLTCLLVIAWLTSSDAEHAQLAASGTTLPLACVGATALCLLLLASRRGLHVFGLSRSEAELLLPLPIAPRAIMAMQLVQRSGVVAIPLAGMVLAAAVSRRPVEHVTHALQAALALVVVALAPVALALELPTSSRGAKRVLGLVADLVLAAGAAGSLAAWILLAAGRPAGALALPGIAVNPLVRLAIGLPAPRGWVVVAGVGLLLVVLRQRRGARELLGMAALSPPWAPSAHASHAPLRRLPRLAGLGPYLWLQATSQRARARFAAGLVVLALAVDLIAHRATSPRERQVAAASAFAGVLLLGPVLLVSRTLPAATRDWLQSLPSPRRSRAWADVVAPTAALTAVQIVAAAGGLLTAPGARAWELALLVGIVPLALIQSAVAAIIETALPLADALGPPPRPGAPIALLLTAFGPSAAAIAVLAAASVAGVLLLASGLGPAPSAAAALAIVTVAAALTAAAGVRLGCRR